jgi:signal transduction histidine kinase
MPQLCGHVIQVQTELAPDLPPIMGIEGEIREALTNLMFNSVDAMPSGGILTLRTRVAAGSPTVGETLGPSCIQIEVADTGVGMDEETRRRCLEPFFTTKGERGTGLGLAMVYGTAQRHGADMESQSAVTKGTTVTEFFHCAQALSNPGDWKLNRRFRHRCASWWWMTILSCSNRSATP